MAYDDHGGARWQLVEVAGQPFNLRIVDARFPGTVFGHLNGIQDDEVIALVVEGIMGGSDSLLKHLLAESWAACLKPALAEDAEMVVIPDGMVNLQPQGLLGVPVEIKEVVGSLAVHGEGIEDVVSALNGKVGLEGCRFAKGHGTSLGGFELRLDVGVGDKQKVEGTRFRGRGLLGREGAGK